MRKWRKKAVSLLLALALCVGLLPAGSARAAEALDLSEVRELLNSETLYPQRTGYPKLDQMLESLLAPYEGKDTYTKIKGLYDWTVVNIDYSWKGYSQNWAPAYDKFALRYDLDYETGLPKVYPEDMIYRAYHMLTERTGVCYDWGILFAVMARYVGIESYVHTGILRIGGWTGHHGWTELKLGGKNYIFDAQQDNRELKTLLHPDPHYHFGILASTAARWMQSPQENGPRDASLLPVTAERVRSAQVSVKASRSGTVEGTGSYMCGEEVTLTAVGDVPLAGWYSAAGELLNQEPFYTFTLENDTELLALFQGDYFVDLPAGEWYVEDVCAAAELGLFHGVGRVTFEPRGRLTRAMLATLLFRADGAEPAEEISVPFTDVDPDAWYADAVQWAYQAGVVRGVANNRFAPNDDVTREQAATMIVRYLEQQGVVAEAGELGFADADDISGYAEEPMGIAAGLRILRGYQDGTIRPRQVITRAESAAILLRMEQSLEAA